MSAFVSAFTGLAGEAMDFTLNAVDMGIIIASLVAVVAIGLIAGRKQGESALGYFLASGKLRWWIIGAGFVATSVSSEQIVGTVGSAYQYGMGIANWEWFYLLSYTMIIVFFVPIYLKNRIVTVPELLTKRFGPVCGDIYSWIMMVAYIVIFTAPVLYGGSLAINRLTGWNFYTVLWTMVVLVGLYSTIGGLRSVVWTDAVQCLFLVGGGLILFFIALHHIPGGWPAMENASPERFHLYRPPDAQRAPFLGIIFASFGVWLFYSSTNQVMIQRVLAARSAWDGKMGIIFAAIINLVRPLVCCFLGFFVYHWIHVLQRAPELADKDFAWPFALKTFGPSWGLRGIILAGFLAAVMSTISSLGNSTATIFSLDVYKRMINKKAGDRELVLVGRITTVVALVLAALIAPNIRRLGGIFDYFQTGVTYLATPFVSVILLGFLWKRTNYQGGLFGLIGGVAITAILAIGLPVVGVKLHWLYVAAIAQALIMGGIVIVSLLTPPPPEARWKPFQWTPSMLRSEADLEPRPWYHNLWIWYGLFAAIWIGIYIRFW